MYHLLGKTIRSVSDAPDEMRQRADWMVPADDALLEYVRDAGMVPPAVIAVNIDIHRKYAGERCRELAERGLLEKHENAYYSLAALGRRYLDEELEPGELELTGEE